MAAGFSPLDEALGLLPSSSSPRLVEALVRLGALVPFEQVPEHLAFFLGAPHSREGARRLTETAGSHLVAVEAEEVDVLEATLPDPPAGPPVQQLSVDGAMIPLVGGQWGEGKLVSIGTVTAQPDAEGVPQPHTVDLSYFARLADADTFGRLATLETHRRGTTTAGTVAAVLDGAVWLQHFVDLHRSDAVRILDFPHAAEHLAAAATAVWGEGSAAATCWRSGCLTELKRGEPAAVLAAVATLPAEQAASPPAAVAVVQQTLEYLAARWPQIQYAQFRAAGLPIGSGSVENGHKVVTQARLKGRGMHWAPANVNPLLALRCALVNGRWAERWEQLTLHWRRASRQDRARRHTVRRQTAATAAAAPVPAPLPEREPKPKPMDIPPPPPPPTAPPPNTIIGRRPTPAHPWAYRQSHSRLPRSGAPPPAKR